MGFLMPQFLTKVILIFGSVQWTFARSIWNVNVSEKMLPEQWLNGNQLFDDTIKARTALRVKIWPNGVVPYKIDNDFVTMEKEIIIDAMADIEKVSCIKFKPWAPEDEDYLFIRDLQHCVSYIGFQGGVQLLSLSSKWCIYHGIIIHEIMHALGFIHEHCRDDRDDYVQINFDNILKEYKSNFEKYNPEEIDHLGENYDYNSIMHYDQYAYAIDHTKPTIIPKDPSINLDAKDKLSAADIRKLNKLYKC